MTEKNILYVKGGMDIGGATASDLMLLNELQRIVPGITIKVLAGIAHQNIRDDVGAFNREVVINPNLDRYNGSKAENIFKAIYEETTSNTLVILSQGYTGDNIELSSAGVKVIDTGVPVIFRHHNLGSPLTLLEDIIQDEYVRHAVVNYSDRKYITSNTGHQADVVLPGICDTNEYPLDIYGHLRLIKDKLEIKEDEICVLQPTRWVEEKGIKQTQEACANTGKKIVILGVSCPENYQVTPNVRVIGLGGVSPINMWQYYMISDFVFFLPNSSETFGMPIAESLHYGVPCVTHDIYNDRGENISDELFNGVNLLSSDSFHKMVAHTNRAGDTPLSDNKRIVQEKFSTKVSADKILEMISYMN